MKFEVLINHWAYVYVALVEEFIAPRPPIGTVFQRIITIVRKSNSIKHEIYCSAESFHEKSCKQMYPKGILFHGIELLGILRIVFLIVAKIEEIKIHKWSTPI